MEPVLKKRENIIQVQIYCVRDLFFFKSIKKSTSESKTTGKPHAYYAISIFYKLDTLSLIRVTYFAIKNCYCSPKILRFKNVYDI